MNINTITSHSVTCMHIHTPILCHNYTGIGQSSISHTNMIMYSVRLRKQYNNCVNTINAISHIFFSLDCFNTSKTRKQTNIKT